jgi:ParB-like chromosome segregation protein Spo0J
MTGLDVGLTPAITGAGGDESDLFDPANDIDSLPVIDVPIDSLRIGFFLRGTGTDPAHVKLLAEAVSYHDLPPILIQEKNWRIIDGMHRLEAAKLHGEKKVRARVVNCTDEEAFILAVKSNTLHGLPLSRADRVEGAKRILTWHPDWSDRAVGVATGLSAKTIAGIRRRSGDEIQQFSKRLGRDGKRRPVANAEGRRRAVDYITARPDASLREVAREADVSLGTVHDVRARMRRGLDPLAVGARRPSDRRAAEIPADAPAGRPQPGDIASLRDTRCGPQQQTWPTVSAKLANDPSLKYTEGGRNFIRWMATHILRGSEWKEFIDAIPPHWLKEVSLVAENASGEWRDFAEQLKRRQNQAV